MPASYTQTKTIDEIYTRHAENYMGDAEYRDSVYRPRPMLVALREKARKTTGGQNLKHRLNFGTTARGGTLSRNGRIVFDQEMNQTASTWTWSVLYEPCFVSWWDLMEVENSPEKTIGLLEQAMKDTDENLLDTILGQITQTSKAATDDLNTLREIVAATGATGGLNPATAGQTNWAAQNEDTINWGVEGVGRTRELLTKIEQAKGKGDVLVLPSAFRDESCAVGDAMQVSNINATTRGGTLYANLGSTVVTVLGLPVLSDYTWDTNQSATGLVLDLSAVHLIENARWSMHMWPFKDMTYTGLPGQASVKFYVAQLTCSNRRNSGSLTTLS